MVSTASSQAPGVVMAGGCGAGGAPGEGVCGRRWRSAAHSERGALAAAVSCPAMPSRSHPTTPAAAAAVRLAVVARHVAPAACAGLDRPTPRDAADMVSGRRET